MKIVITIIVLAALVIGVSVMVKGGKKVDTEAIEQQPPQRQSPASNREAGTGIATGKRERGSGLATGRYALKEILVSDVAQECSFSDPNGVSGTVYVATGSMRGDFTSTVNGKAMTSHIITEDTTSFVWTDGMNQGVKTTISDIAPSGSNNSPSSVSMDQKYDYTCASWTADDSKFSLPSEIKFSDIANSKRDAASGLPTGR